MERKSGASPPTSSAVRRTPRLMRGNLLFLIVIVTFTVSFGPTISLSSAHPGRTDFVGCHTCRTHCPNWGLFYGEYHCHRSKGLPQPKEPVKSHLTNSGAGYVDPAPRYTLPVKSRRNYKIRARKISNRRVSQVVKNVKDKIT